MTNPIYLETDKRWYETRRILGRVPGEQGNMVERCNALEWATSPTDQYSLEREWVMIEREPGAQPFFKCSRYGILRTGLVQAMIERFESATPIPAPAPLPPTPEKRSIDLSLETIVTLTGLTRTHCGSCRYQSLDKMCELHRTDGRIQTSIVDGRRCQQCLAGTWRAQRTVGAHVWIDAGGAGWYETSRSPEELVWSESLSTAEEVRRYILTRDEARYWCEPPSDQVPLDLFQAMVSRYQELFPNEEAAL